MGWPTKENKKKERKKKNLGGGEWGKRKKISFRVVTKKKK